MWQRKGDRCKFNVIYQEFQHEELTLESALSKQNSDRPENIFVCFISENSTATKIPPVTQYTCDKFGTEIFIIDAKNLFT